MEKLVFIQCPICNSGKSIQLPNVIFQTAKSLAAISIPKGSLCEHTFQAYIDKNYAVRGYQKVDFELPSDIDETKLNANLLLESDLKDINSIKWNLSPQILSCLLRGIVFDENIVFVLPKSKESLLIPLERFIKIIFGNSFKSNLRIITDDTYKKIKNDLKRNIIIGWDQIIRDKDKVIKDLSVETKIVNKFYDANSEQEATINLEYEIKKLFNISEKVIDITKDFKEKETIDIISLMNQLNEKYSIVLEVQYLEYIIEIIRHYFKNIVPVEIYSKVVSFLNY